MSCLNYFKNLLNNLLKFFLLISSEKQIKFTKKLIKQTTNCIKKTTTFIKRLRKKESIFYLCGAANILLSLLKSFKQNV